MSTGSDAPAPPLSAEDVLRALAEDAPGAYVDALASADAHREALVGPLLAALERGIADPMRTRRVAVQGSPLRSNRVLRTRLARVRVGPGRLSCPVSARP